MRAYLILKRDKSITQTSVSVQSGPDSEEQLITHKYDLNQKWSQTIDFPRKKKGTQSDPIGTRDIGSQVLSKDLLA